MTNNYKKYKVTDLICKNKYGTFIVPKEHKRPVTHALRNGKVYEPNTIEFIRKNYDNKNIVTAGTYIGDFLPAFHNIPKVFAFEPVTENYIYANLNKNLNNLDNVTLENLCLSNINTKQNMVTHINNVPCGGGSSIIQIDSLSENKRTEEVTSIKLDDYLNHNRSPISIIQLDVEGHETQVIEGGIKTIEKNKPIIIIESKPKKYIKNKLFELGYSYHHTKLHHNTILYIKNKHILNF